MKRTLFVVAALLFLVAAVPLFAVERSQRTIVDDVIRMTAAGVSDDAILSFVQSSRDRFNVTADDVIAMTDAKVSKSVIKAVVDESTVRGGREVAAAPQTRLYVSPYPYYYDPYYYYDPFWYGPRVYMNFGFGGIYRGGFGGYRGGFGGRRGGGGHGGRH